MDNKRILKVVCIDCGKCVDEKEGNVEGETSTICRECWNIRFPREPYPEDLDDVLRDASK